MEAGPALAGSGQRHTQTAQSAGQVRRLRFQGVADPSQRWVLHELVRYLQHPRSGASGFEDMGAAWVPVRDAVSAGTLRPSNRQALTVAASWERLLRQVCPSRAADSVST